MPSPIPITKHLYVNLYDVDPEILGDENTLVSTIVGALRAVGVTPLDIKSWSFGGKKGGVSIIIVLEGAHVVLHTWVEYRYATLDILVTGGHDPNKIFESILRLLKPRTYRAGFTYRGTNARRE